MSANDPFAWAASTQEQRHNREHKAKNNSTPAVSFRLDPDLMRDFKMACVREGRTMTSVIEELLAGWTSAH